MVEGGVIAQNHIHFGNRDLPPLLPLGLNTASSGLEGRQVKICADAARQLFGEDGFRAVEIVLLTEHILCLGEFIS